MLFSQSSFRVLQRWAPGSSCLRLSSLCLSHPRAEFADKQSHTDCKKWKYDRNDTTSVGAIIKLCRRHARRIHPREQAWEPIREKMSKDIPTFWMIAVATWGTSSSCLCISKTGRKYLGAAAPTAIITSLDLLGMSSKAHVRKMVLVNAPRREYDILNDGEVTCCGTYVRKDLKKDGGFVACNRSFSEPFDKYHYFLLHMICLRTSADLSAKHPGSSLFSFFSYHVLFRFSSSQCTVHSFKAGI